MLDANACALSSVTTEPTPVAWASGRASRKRVLVVSSPKSRASMTVSHTLTSRMDCEQASEVSNFCAIDPKPRFCSSLL